MTTDPLDEWFPLDDAEHQAQVAGLLALLRERPPGGARVLDLGCGSGRVARPLADAGMHVTALDRDETALVELRDRAPTVRTVHADLLDADAPVFTDGDRYDAVLVLGHTLLTVTDPLAAAALLARCAALLTPGGVVAIDDFPHALWADVAEGNWQAGFATVTHEGRAVDLQLVWAPGDPIIAFRAGDDVDEHRPELDERDRALRLYSMGELSLLASAAGLHAPERLASHHLILLRR